MERYPSYNSRNYPVGLSEFVNTFPPERRDEVRAAVFDIHLRRKAEDAWVEEQVQGMWVIWTILSCLSSVGPAHGSRCALQLKRRVRRWN